MNIKIGHTKNPAIGWDVSVSITVDKGEKISSIEVKVNDISVANEQPKPPLSGWDRVLRQQGVYPGDNKVEVTALDDKANETRGESRW